jgi:hypothetical protein
VFTVLIRKIETGLTHFWTAETSRGEAGQRVERTRSSFCHDHIDTSGRKVEDDEQVEVEGETDLDIFSFKSSKVIFTKLLAIIS